MSSKTTDIEPSVTCGFYDSLSGDRKYYASQLNDLVDGMITNGVFYHVGERLVVTANGGNVVKVGTGKCWFNRTWTLNDAPLLVECSEGPSLRPRYDAIIVRIDTRTEVRDNFIQFKQGVEDSNATYPDMDNGDGVYEYPLCYIKRNPDSTEIKPTDIINMVGTNSTPFVTGVAQQASLDDLLGQWRAELDEFVASEQADVDSELESFKSENQKDFNEWYEGMKALMTNAENEFKAWSIVQETLFDIWFGKMKDQLSTDAAGNLQTQLDKESITRILLNGFADGTKVINEDGTKITSTDSQGRVLVKMFRNNFTTCLTTLYSRVDGPVLGMVNKIFSDDGTTITSTVSTYLDTTNTEEV